MAYGSGSIFRRGKIYYVQAWVNGRQIGPLSSRSTIRKVAQDKLDAIIGKRSTGEIRGAREDDITVWALLEDFIDYALESVADGRGIQNRLNKHVKDHRIARIKMRDLTSKDLRGYREDRVQEGAAETTINREMTFIRAGLRRALKEGRVHRLPHFPMVKENNARTGFIEEWQFLKFLSCLHLCLRTFAVLVYYSGMRRDEALRLTLSDVDLDRGFVEIRKTKNSEPRMVPIFDGPMLQWLQWSVENAQPGQTKLLMWEDGRTIKRWSIYEPWHEAAKASGVYGFLPHDSRRSCSRNLRNSGVPRTLRKKICGWKSDSSEERYGIVDIEDVQAVKAVWANRKTTAQPLQTGTVNPPDSIPQVG